jgi:hypothetical protein
MEIPLRLGPLKADGYRIYRSGVRWLREPGEMCRANQVVAYFNLSVESTGALPGGPSPFGGEREFQVACASRVGGRLRYDTASAPGGHVSVTAFNAWDADSELGHLEMDGTSGEQDDDPGSLRLLMLTGRRMAAFVDAHSGLLPGWHSRSRGWWCDEGEKPITLLSLGICDVTGVILGESCAFLEMFRSEREPRQMVFVPDHPIAPAAPVLLDQLERTPAQFKAMSADLQTGLYKAGAVPTADDWLFAGTMLSTQQYCPIRENYELLSASGLTRSGPADAILLSLSAEPPAILRHKTLGYRLNFLRHRQAAAGPLIRNWLANAFESVERTIDDIKADYERLFNAIEKATGARVLILNRMSTSGKENISCYAPFDPPMSATLANIASKELNLMLHDLAAGRNVAILDVDAIAADIGAGEHLPDGIHQSRVLQNVLREEILHFMRDLKPKG